MLKKNLFPILILIILLLSLITVLILKSRNNKSEPLDAPINNIVTGVNSYPLSHTTSSTVDGSITMNDYINPNNIFRYSFPSNWTFRAGREGIGLIPISEKENPIGEIVTIFTTKTDLNLIEWSRRYDGSGYQTEKEMTINGYQAYYIFKEDQELTMQIYTFKKDNNIVRINFRQKDGVSGDGSQDFTEYLEDFEKIVDSIRYF